jgi:hypothetical protein
MKRTTATLFFSGLVALLCTGALIFIFGLFFWFLDDFVFNFLNLPPKLEYDAASLLRSTFFWLESHPKLTFFVLWAIVLLVGFRGNWMKKKLPLVKEKIQQHSK